MATALQITPEGKLATSKGAARSVSQRAATGNYRRLETILVRFLPSVADLMFVLPILLLCLKSSGLSGLLNDGDTGWHIRTGEWILSHRQVPHSDLFSYTMSGKPWFAWEWLWDVVAAWLHTRGGLAAVVLSSLLLLCLTSVLVFRLSLRRTQNPLVSALVTFFFCNGSSLHWHARPHLVTLLFVAVFCSILELPQKKPRLLWALPPLMILWTNLHGGFFVGFTLLGAYVGGAVLNVAFATELEARSKALRDLAIYSFLTLACVAATFLNPYGYQLHLHVGRYLLDNALLDSIGEFQTVSFHQPVTRYLEVVIAFGILAAYQAFRRGQFADALVLLVWGHLALIAGRNIPIFLVVAAAPVASVVNDWLSVLKAAPLTQSSRRILNFINTRYQSFAVIDALPRLHLFSVGGFCCLVTLAFGSHPPPFCIAEFGLKIFPVDALSSHQELVNPDARLFTLDQWADYLLYSDPTAKVFFDGRSDFYGSRFSLAYVDLVNAKAGWENQLNRYGVERVLLPPSSALTAVLKESSRWHVTYDDGRAVLFNRKKS